MPTKEQPGLQPEARPFWAGYAPAFGSLANPQCFCKTQCRTRNVPSTTGSAGVGAHTEPPLSEWSAVFEGGVYSPRSIPSFTCVQKDSFNCELIHSWI